MTRLSIRRAVEQFVITAVLLAALASSAFAQASGPLAQKSSNAAEMTAIAQQEGHVRVIVLLTSPVAPTEIVVDADRLASVKDRVAVARNAVIATHFGGATVPPSDRGFERGLTVFDVIAGFALNVTNTELQALAADSRVTLIQHDRPLPPTLIDSVPLIGMSGIPTVTGTGFAVAVLDTGILANHEFLTGRVVFEMCLSNAGGGGGNVTLCPNGTPQQTGAGSANVGIAACLNGGTNICDHGSHVAGIAAGANTNQQAGEPTRGVASTSRIMAIQVFTRFNAAASCTPRPAPCVKTFPSDYLAALNVVLTNLTPVAGVRVVAVNMSLGGGNNPATCDGDASKPFIDALRANGVATVIASGNDSLTNGIGSPGCVSTAVTVGSSTKFDGISFFSNMSAVVDLMAPGSSIQSSVPTAAGSTTTYSFFNGTSMATPHVAGAFAAIRSACPGIPLNAAGNDQIQTALANTGTTIVDNRTGGTINRPRIRVDLAAQQLGCVLPAMVVTPATNILASGPQGGPFSPASFQYQLSTTFSTVNYNITGVPAWLTASSTSGSLTSTPTTITFTVNANANALAAGNHVSTISFNNLTSGLGSTTRTATLAVAPANDNFANAAKIVTGQTLTVNTVNATKQASEPNHAGNAGGKSVWYKFSALTSGQVTIRTAGSNYDTLLAVYSGTAVNLLSLIAANDDFGGTAQSQVSFSVNAGQSYYIAVDGFNGASGNLSLNVNLQTLACDSREQLSDFNGDGRADFVTRRADGTLAMYQMNGFETVGAQIIGAVGPAWTLIGVADFNGDGRGDLMFRHTDGRISVYLMNGFQITAAQIVGAIGTEWEVVGLGDLNGDGRADFIVRRADGTLAGYLMNGLTIQAAQIIGAVGHDWRLVGVADFNGDGRSDLMFRKHDGKLSVYLMNGLAVQAAQVIGAVGVDWTVSAVRDFNGDGRADFLMRHSDGRLALYLMNGLVIQAAQIIGAVGVEWTVSGAGDVNGDGRADLLLRRPNGSFSVYLMDGFQILDARIVGSIGTEWTSCYGPNNPPLQLSMK